MRRPRARDRRADGVIEDGAIMVMTAFIVVITLTVAASA